MKVNVPKLLTRVFSVILISSIVWSCKKAAELSGSNAVVSADVSDAAAATGRPNIILILADDVGYGLPTVNGGQTYQTPNIDRLAAAGMRFTQCYGSPLCSPSRTMFMTGKYNFRNYNEWGILDLNEKMMSNVLQSAGYKTYVAGKWAFDGGDVSIKAHGFDSYSVWSAFLGDNGSHYKTPRIYENSGYLPDNVVRNQYGDDIFTDRVLSFIKDNRKNNFFVYFPITLCHSPYSPTPDDPQYAAWDPKSPSDSSYFPSMVKYMDKKIGMLADSLRAWRLFNNTILVFAGDNGTPHGIWFTQDGVYQEGSKSSTNTYGTHVPLIVTWPAGGVRGGQVNNNLIDFTDFTATAFEAAGISTPADYGPVDGVSFLNQLRGLPNTPREWVFCHYKPDTDAQNGNVVRRWINNTQYKLYDSTGRFYNVVLDPEEKRPIKPSKMTPAERALQAEFQSIMDTLH
ncbi:sulfatase-like hydrolase/transferase [Panacibacter sp. DH6]|uniref:Sulfatase-like hydrolase/transferase n=1 Tax=Panacibacter microcysteis TaxID=2793269 RepID=A0A931GWK8_9BACT|nr:sulfatase-like hydrolase/transferase [Panacibacter microcysteis]MBG9377785.1 sulfatase-like hydrolase/transferase [Panacibacter microcysteis]